MHVGEHYNPRGLFTGVYIPESLVSSTVISSSAKIMFGRLCWYSGAAGEVFPSQATLAKETGSSLRAVENQLKELEDAGFIERQRVGSRIFYNFCWHDILEQSLKIKNPPKTVGCAENQTEPAREPTTSTAQFGKKPECINNVLREEENIREYRTSSCEEFSEEEKTKDSISVDNNAEGVHTLWKEVFGQDLMLSTKDRRWIEEILIPRFPVPLDKLVEYSTAETGKPTFKKFRDFLPGNKPAMFRRRPEFGPVASQDRSTGASGSRRYQTERQAPPSSFIAPVEASDWNEQISGRQWEVWDSKLNDAWMALPKSPFPWPKLLAKCVLLAPHKPDLTIGFALKHWASIINGNMDWLIPHEKPSHLQTKQDRIRALVQAHEARKKEKNDGIERAKP